MNRTIGIIPCITYSGCAEEAVNYYMTVFPNSEINMIKYYQKGDRGVEGKVNNITFKLMNQPFMAFDMEKHELPKHNWSISFYINCIDGVMFDTLFNKLSITGTVLMKEEAFSNYRKAAWITDKFGITWQLVWE